MTEERKKLSRLGEKKLIENETSANKIFGDHFFLVFSKYCPPFFVFCFWRCLGDIFWGAGSAPRFFMKTSLLFGSNMARSHVYPIYFLLRFWYSGCRGDRNPTPVDRGVFCCWFRLFVSFFPNFYLLLCVVLLLLIFNCAPSLLSLCCAAKVVCDVRCVTWKKLARS